MIQFGSLAMAINQAADSFPIGNAAPTFWESNKLANGCLPIDLVISSSVY